MNTFWHIIIIFASLAGFTLSFYIGHKKNKKEKMVCPLKSNCDAVINSDYSKFLGFPVEKLGLLYYALMVLAYGLFLIAPNLAVPSVVLFVLAITVGAFLFSIRLIFIQAFKLKEWCTWCLTSAGLCIIIFISAMMGL